MKTVKVFETLGEMCSGIRRLNGETQAQLAEALGCSVSTIYRIENERYPEGPSLDWPIRIAKHYGRKFQISFYRSLGSVEF